MDRPVFQASGVRRSLVAVAVAVAALTIASCGTARMGGSSAAPAGAGASPSVAVPTPQPSPISTGAPLPAPTPLPSATVQGAAAASPRSGVAATPMPEVAPPFLTWARVPVDAAVFERAAGGHVGSSGRRSSPVARCS
jgi:hypothetical protein